MALLRHCLLAFYPLSLEKSLNYNANLFLAPMLNYSDHSGNHASLIIGKRYNPLIFQTEYILRNSWGANSCLVYYNGYNPLTPQDYEECGAVTISVVGAGTMATTTFTTALSKEETENIQKCLQEKRDKAVKPFRCESGNYIVSKDNLEKVLHNIYYITRETTDTPNVCYGRIGTYK